MSHLSSPAGRLTDAPSGDLETILGRDFMTRIEAGETAGMTLPNAAYTSEAFLTLEHDRCFARGWMLAGLAHRIPGPGDAEPVEVAGRPVLLLRDKAGAVRAFHNVCRHRGAKLVAEPQQGAVLLTCPNHAWAYDLEGNLRSRPHFRGGGQHERITEPCHAASLKPVRCAVWHDWIFVNLEGDAPPLEDHLAPLTDRLTDYDFSQLRFGGELTFEVEANWKLAFENFIEPYHVFACHPWLHSFVPMEERSPPASEGRVMSCGYDFQAPDPARGLGLPYFADLPEAKKTRGDWFLMLPSFAFEVFPDQVVLLLSTPLSPSRTRERLIVYFIGDEALGPDYAEARQRVLDNWRDLNREDIGILERMQQGRRSEGFDGGVLSPYWDNYVETFTLTLIEALR